MPLVSIITPLQNKGPFVAETIRSVLAQTLPDWELIVVENGSTDNGPEVVGQFSDARVRLVISPKCGPGAARNFGLGLGTGEWVLFLDADDLIEPSYLEAQLECAAANREASLIVSCSQEFVQGRFEQRTMCRPREWGESVEQVLQRAIVCAPWSVHTALIRRSALTPELGWPEECDRFPSEDSAFWFSLLLSTKLAWCANAGALYRKKTSSSRNETKNIELWILGLCKIVDRNVAALARLGRSPSDEQCRNILSAFEQKYWIAWRTRKKSAAKIALQSAKWWLKNCQPRSLEIIAREILGVHGALFLKKSLARLRLLSNE